MFSIGRNSYPGATNMEVLSQKSKNNWGTTFSIIHHYILCLKFQCLSLFQRKWFTNHDKIACKLQNIHENYLKLTLRPNDFISILINQVCMQPNITLLTSLNLYPLEIGIIPPCIPKNELNLIYKESLFS